MLKYQEGEIEAFNVIYQRHQAKVYSYLKQRVFDRQIVEDIFQKVFFKFHRSRHLYNSKYDVPAWIYTITKSVFLDYLKLKRLDTTEFREENFASELINDLEFDLDSETTLSKNERQALKERYFGDKEFLEIAEILETTESNARKIISRGLKKLKEKYKKKGSS